MVTVKEVKTKKEQKQFIEFPLLLYRDCPYFVPPLYADERKLFKPNYVYYDTSDAVYFNAYDETGKMVGRISGILQRASNEKTGEKRVRFTRFDSINDREVAHALFHSVESWARSRGMDKVCGPLGFSDLEREGLLIEGFDQLSTFEEQYNYDYYPELIEHCGYTKETDWVERKIFYPAEPDPKMKELSAYLLKRYDLHMSTAKNTREFLRRYSDRMFDLLDITYAGLYGTVPFTDGMKKMILSNFSLIIDLRFTSVILDRDDNVVCFALCMPSIAKAVQKSGGRLTLPCLLRILRAIKKPEIIDLALIGVHPDYMDRGVSTALLSGLMDMLSDRRISHAETNLNLEDNYRIQNQWKRFDSILHKRRRSYIKHI